VLFNSEIFLLYFLPVVIFTYLLIKTTKSLHLFLIFLILFSFVFYIFWSLKYFFLLIFSILLNYFLSKCIIKYSSKKLLLLGIGSNIFLLAYFKYYNFFIENINYLFNYNLDKKNIILPLAISFYTFTQIAFLVDCYRKKIKSVNIFKYFFFVSFFPHLIAGPILIHEQFFPQIKKKLLNNIFIQNFSVGITIFIIGLAKKNILADNLGIIANNYFDANSYVDFSAGEAWLALFSYAFQIYFDFSGYSDMAIGIAKFFGINFPQNFNSPYQSKSVIEFWKRWHITLSNFINNYLFYSLSLIIFRNKLIRIVTENYLFFSLTSVVLLTFSISGLWHGASWNFVIWGLMHGILITINSYYASSSLKLIFEKIKNINVIYFIITFFFITLTWVPFRSGFYGISKSIEIYKNLFNFEILNFIYDINLLNLKVFLIRYKYLFLSIFIAFFAKNSSLYFRNKKHWSTFNFNFGSSVKLILIVISIVIFGSNVADPFIYFQF
jgi:D-alanyl-lipoteichoic acid acyltransferase DltB (MBOAT superfamily)